MGCSISSSPLESTEALPDLDKEVIPEPIKLEIEQRGLYQLKEALVEDSRNGSAITKEADDTIITQTYPLLNDVVENGKKCSRPTSSQSKRSNKLVTANSSDEKISVVTPTLGVNSRKSSASRRSSSAKSNKSKSSNNSQVNVASQVETAMTHCSELPKDPPSYEQSDAEHQNNDNDVQNSSQSPTDEEVQTNLPLQNEKVSDFLDFGLPVIDSDPEIVPDNENDKKSDNSATEAVSGNEESISPEEIGRPASIEDNKPSEETDNEPATQENSTENNNESSPEVVEQNKILFPHDNDVPDDNIEDTVENTKEDNEENEGTIGEDNGNKAINFPDSNINEKDKEDAISSYNLSSLFDSAGPRMQAVNSSVTNLDYFLSDTESIEEAPCSLAASSSGLIISRPATSKKNNSAGVARGLNAIASPAPSTKDRISMEVSPLNTTSSIHNTTELKDFEPLAIKMLRFDLPDEIDVNKLDMIDDRNSETTENSKAECDTNNQNKNDEQAADTGSKNSEDNTDDAVNYQTLSASEKLELEEFVSDLSMFDESEHSHPSPKDEESTLSVIDEDNLIISNLKQESVLSALKEESGLYTLKEESDISSFRDGSGEASLEEISEISTFVKNESDISVVKEKSDTNTSLEKVFDTANSLKEESDIVSTSKVESSSNIKEESTNSTFIEEDESDFSIIKDEYSSSTSENVKSGATTSLVKEYVTENSLKEEFNTSTSLKVESGTFASLKEESGVSILKENISILGEESDIYIIEEGSVLSNLKEKSNIRSIKEESDEFTEDRNESQSGSEEILPVNSELEFALSEQKILNTSTLDQNEMSVKMTSIDDQKHTTNEAPHPKTNKLDQQNTNEASKILFNESIELKGKSEPSKTVIDGEQSQGFRDSKDAQIETLEDSYLKNSHDSIKGISFDSDKAIVKNQKEESSLNVDQENSNGPNKEYSRNSEKENSIDPNKENSYNPNKKSYDDTNKESSLDLDNESSDVSNKGCLDVSNKERSDVLNKESSVVLNKESSVVLNKESTDVSNKERSLDPDKESSGITNKESSDITNKESYDIINKGCLDVSNKERSDVLNKESSVVLNKESSDVSNKERSDVPNKERSLDPDKESSDITKKESSDITKKESSDVANKESSGVINTEISLDQGLNEKKATFESIKISSRPNSVAISLSDISSLNGIDLKHVKKFIGQNSSNNLEIDVGSGIDSEQRMFMGF